MRVGFRKLLQFGFIVNAGIGNLEGTGSRRNVGFDIADTRDFGQIASDRGGTGTSEHVGHFEADKGGRRRTSVTRCGGRGIARRVGNWLGSCGAPDHRQENELNHDR